MDFRFHAIALVALLFIAPVSADAGLEDAEDARECGGRIDWDCWHYTAPGPCILYLDPSGTGGACIIY